MGNLSRSIPPLVSGPSTACLQQALRINFGLQAEVDTWCAKLPSVDFARDERSPTR